MTETGSTSKRTHAVPIAAAAVVVALLVGLGVGVLIGQGLQSDSAYLEVKREFTGEVTKISADGAAVSVETSDGTLDSRILNAAEFPIAVGDELVGTIVTVPIEGGSVIEEALVVNAVNPTSR